jgi:hypothetical protein
MMTMAFLTEKQKAMDVTTMKETMRIPVTFS